MVEVPDGAAPASLHADMLSDIVIPRWMTSALLRQKLVSRWGAEINIWSVAAQQNGPAGKKADDEDQISTVKSPVPRND